YADSVNITQPDSITIVSQTTTNIDCYGGNDGTATLSISGGTPPYSENWFGANPNALSAGTYSYQVSDNHGCFNTGSSGNITITQPVMPLTVSEITTNVSCNGGNDGIATLSISGGTPPYFENWNGNDSSALAAGVYSYTITDDAGCIYTGSVSITQPSVLTFDAINTNDVTDCINGDGDIDITISGGTIPYSYLWNNGDTTEDITNLFAGNYSIIVTDSLGCTINSSNIIITNPFQLTWTIDSTNYNGHAIDCYGDSTGGIYITTTGGVGAITYSWVNVLDTSIIISTNDTASNLSAGTYIVTTTDGDCIDFREITIHDPSIISVHDDWVQLNCTGSTPLFSDSLIISGGTAPYTTIWLNGANPDSLSAGVHYYTITDDNGCSIDDSVTLNASNPLSIVAGNETDVACHGDNTGAAVFLITGGVLPYTYLWSNGDTNAVATNLIAGVYSCTIQDDNNCSVTGWVSVSQPSSPLLSSISMINSIACFGDSTGSALITASGGMPPYEYEWDNGETDSLAINLSVGGNFCTITDYNNCELIDGINMTQSPNIIYSDSISDYNSYQIRCYGDNNGLISLTVSGGVPNTQGNPYSYQWTGPNGFTDSSDFIDSLVAGEYSFILSDSLGCEKRDTFLLEEPNLLYTSLDSTYDIECWDHANNPSSGFAKISIYGGVTDYMVNNWTIPFAGSIYNFYDVYPDGTHIYTVTDLNNCTYTDSFTLIHLTADSLYATSTLSDYNGVNISCKGYSDGWITIDTILGGLPPYSFNWSNGDSTLLIDTLSAGWYTSIVTDSFGCLFIDNIQITEPDFALDTYLDTFNVSCNGYCDGMLIANSIDGTVNVTGPYTFQWYDNMNNLMSTNDTLDSLCAGLYSLIVTDNNGCIDQLSPPIFEPLILSVNLDSLFNVSENGFADGAIYINTSGGNGGYISSWTGPNGYTSIDEDIENLSPGTYQIVISDVLGCYSDTSTYIITEPPSVSINVDSINSSFITTCYDSCDGSITINPILSPPVAFNTYWTGPNGYTSTDEDIDSLCAGNYILYIISGVDSVEFNFTINEPEILAIVMHNNDILCYSGNTFTTAYTYGGTLPYNWLWSNNTQNISALLDSGTHYVTVTDYNGCTISDSITLSQPDSMWFTADTIPPSCSNRTDGAISIDNIHNGTAPFLYSIDNFTTYQTSDIFINLSPGGYLISIEDSNGCIAIDSFFISNPTTFSVTTLNPIYSADTVDCNGDCNGLVEFLYNGENGIPDASWEQWSGPNLNGDLCPGIYNCIFTDDNGCTATLNNITIHNEDPIVITSTSSNSPTCKDGDDGSASVIATGNSNVEYFWYGIPNPTGPPPFVGGDPTGLDAGIYWCHIIDGTCVDSIAVVVPQNNTPFLVEITYNGSDLATGNTTGGGVIESYNWSTGDTIPTISPATNGQYWLIVTDTNGCISDTAFYNVIGIPSSIEELSNNLFMYPNPTTGILFIDSENNFSKIDILNHIGEKVFSKEMKTPHAKLELDLSRFSKGIYHIQITINNQLLNNKIILQ
ncbi:T9SS type A sorting domain-containing protein, partial [Flavobacteriales bacterium]|nr:T9SS type A sorting domain-containing protein [Flavobacteriales bacterium]